MKNISELKIILNTIGAAASNISFDAPDISADNLRRHIIDDTQDILTLIQQALNLLEDAEENCCGIK